MNIYYPLNKFYKNLIWIRVSVTFAEKYPA